MPPPPPSCSAHRADIWVGCVVFVAQLAGLGWTFPLSELLSDTPLFHVDSSFHWYQMHAAEAFWRDGRQVGFDPWFAAGHIGGVSYNASAKLPALLGIALSPWLSAGVVYKLYAFFSALLAPLCVTLAMRWLRADRVATAAATLFGFLLWWISAFRWYHTSGMVSFVFASYAALPYIALVWRGLAENLPSRRLLFLGAVGAVGVFYHPLFPLPILFCVPMLILFFWPEVRGGRLLTLVFTVPVLSVLPNLAWILPSLQYPGWSSNSMTPYQKEVDIAIAWNELLGRIVGHARGSRVNPLLWLATLWAVTAGGASRSIRISSAFAVAALALIVFSAVGGAAPMFATLTPNRLSAAAYLLLVVPGGIGVSGIARTIHHRRALPQWSAGVSAAAVAVGLVFYANEVRNEWSRAPVPHYGARPPEVRGVGDVSRWILDWLREHTSADARVLFETSGGRNHDGAHIAGYLALASQREFIGGPYVFMHHAGFWDGTLFGRRISDFRTDELEDRLRLYNIGWAIVHSDQAKSALDRQPGLHRRAQRGQFVVYEAAFPHSYFVEGSGRVVTRDFNEIHLSEIRGPAVTLKYHHVEGMTTTPATRIEAVRVPDDPLPFIRIVEPPGELKLRWR